MTYLHMAKHVLKSTQLINASIEELWDFFCSPLNLATITPPYMNFRITSQCDTSEGLFEGQLITYKVSPLLKVPLTWVTEITQVLKHHSFVDKQKKGPYKLWHHEHIFEQQEKGVLMTDIVTYELPLGIIGEIAHFLFIRKQLKAIFAYRTAKIDDLFDNNANKS